MKRTDGAKSWSRVLSELARVRVSVEWERPTWRVSRQDGPTREALMGRAAALGEYRMGAPLRFEDLRFASSDSAVAVALACFSRGSSDSPAAARAAIAYVEAQERETWRGVNWLVRRPYEPEIAAYLDRWRQPPGPQGG